MSGGLDDLLGGLTGGKGGGGGGIADVLGGILGGGRGATGAAGAGGMIAALAPMLAGLLANGGLQRILANLQANGKGDKVNSWVSTGDNEPLSSGEVREAVGEEEIDRIAGTLGVSQDQAATALAGVLPDLVDQVSPTGELPDDDELDRLARSVEGAAGSQTT